MRLKTLASLYFLPWLEKILNFAPNEGIAFSDHLMSGLTIFGLKFPSLLNYDRSRKNPEANLKNLYQIANPPSDTYIFSVIDTAIEEKDLACGSTLLLEFRI